MAKGPGVSATFRFIAKTNISYYIKNSHLVQVFFEKIPCKRGKHLPFYCIGA
jgi:hypothetical protein